MTDLEAENKTIRAELTQLKMKLVTIAKDTTVTTASNAPNSSQSTITTIALKEPLPLTPLHSHPTSLPLIPMIGRTFQYHLHLHLLHVLPELVKHVNKLAF